jgi:hypothetical protein
MMEIFERLGKLMGGRKKEKARKSSIYRLSKCFNLLGRFNFLSRGARDNFRTGLRMIYLK